MSLVLTDSKPKAAKKHRCWYCGQRIEFGEIHVYRTGVNCGDFWVMRAHQECDDYASKHWDADDYEFHETGDFKRPMTAFDAGI